MLLPQRQAVRCAQLVAMPTTSFAVIVQKPAVLDAS
jgi:hypothetical protein